MEVVGVLCCGKAQLVSPVCLRMQTGDLLFPMRVEAACVELGPCLWLGESWELRQGICCWREDRNCSCTLGAVTCCHLLPAPGSAQCLSDGDAGLSTLLLPQGFCCDARWRPHLRRLCLCLSSLLDASVTGTFFVHRSVKGERWREPEGCCPSLAALDSSASSLGPDLTWLLTTFYHGLNPFVGKERRGRLR